MTFALRPLPRPLAHALSALVLVAWLANMGLLVRSAWSSSPAALATDLAGYTPAARWNGIYYRGEKIGFSVGQTIPTERGYEMREDGRLQMSLLGSSTAIRLSSRAQVDRAFRLRSFSFSLDPGTGPTEVSGAIDGTRLRLTVKTPSGTRSETRQLPEPPALAMNLPRTLAARGLSPGRRIEVSLFDPATLRNAPMTLEVRSREVVRVEGRLVPAFLVEGQFAGVRTRSWITDVGDVVREESAMGLVVVRESRERAQRLSVPYSVRADMLEAAALVPDPPVRIDDPSLVSRLRVRLSPLDRFDREDLDGQGQSASGDVIEVVDPESLRPSTRVPGLERFLRPEPFVESDAPEIRAEARHAVRGAVSPRKQAETLVRYVHALSRRSPPSACPRRSRCCARRSATATSTPCSTWRWRVRWACPRGSPWASSTCAGPSTTTPGPRSGSTARPAGASGCPSTRPSTSSRPTPRTCAWRAAAWTARPASWVSWDAPGSRC